MVELQGACLYVPAIHPRLEEVVTGRAAPGLRVAVVCFEDALSERHLYRGHEKLRRLPTDMPPHAPRVYVRPRHAAMLSELQALESHGRWSGYVLPKLSRRNADEWLNPIEQLPTRFMPILETCDVFCPKALRELCDRLTKGALSGLIDAVRIGGTDLFSLLHARRPHGKTIYQTVLGPTVCAAAAYVMSRGLPVTAPVCEALSPDNAMSEEVEQDVESGFVGKTAVTPAQVELINRLFAVTATELDEARTILSSERAVFRSNSVMCETAPHSRWAHRVEARYSVFGLRPDERAISRTGSVRR